MFEWATDQAINHSVHAVMIAQRAANFFVSEGECPTLLHTFTNVPSDDELFSFVYLVILSHTYVHTHKLMSRSRCTTHVYRTLCSVLA